MTVIETLQTIPNVRVIYADQEKTFCSVKITVKRMELIDSGSMQFTHPRYITFGQLVIFTNVALDPDQSGALFFKVNNGEEAKDIIENIADYIPREKDEPDDCVLIGE